MLECITSIWQAQSPHANIQTEVDDDEDSDDADEEDNKDKDEENKKADGD